jgi:pimeloyl-ACP methyl ester carboxylesterase
MIQPHISGTLTIYPEVRKSRRLGRPILRRSRAVQFRTRVLVLVSAFMLAPFIVAVPANAQYYAVQIGFFRSGATVEHRLTTGYCGSPPHPFSLSDNTGFPPFIAWMSSNGVLPVMLNSQFKKVNGTWRPATASYTLPGPGASARVFITTTLDGGGILTTFESGWFASPTGTQGFSGVETIDLNTGGYSQTVEGFGNNFIGDGCSDVFQVRVSGSISITLIPDTPITSLAILNPYSCTLKGYSCTTVPSATTGPLTGQVTSAPLASAISADGQSAAVIVVSSADSTDPVQLTLSGPPGFSGALGSLSPYDSNFLNKQPSGTNPLTVNSHYCDSNNNCFFLALLWAPQGMSGGLRAAPTTNAFAPVPLTIVATQASSSPQATILLQPPPLVLVHGIWSSAAQAWPPFEQWLSANYPHRLIFPADYKRYNYYDFSVQPIQAALEKEIADALAAAAAQGFVARRVDVVAHSMGGLVTRYYIEKGPPFALSYLPIDPIHKLITIGTPELGSALATTLWDNQAKVLPLAGVSPTVGYLCSFFSVCTLGDIFAQQGMPIATGVLSLEPGNANLPSGSEPFGAIVGQAPQAPLSVTELKLDLLIGSFVPDNTITNILGSPNDTIVSAGSQSAGAVDTATVSGIVHTPLSPGDTGETASPCVFAQAAYWLMGGSGKDTSAANCTIDPPNPVLDLTGYTQVPASNVAISPATGSTLTINSATNIAATSSTKTITEILLFQTVSDPSDVPVMYSTQSPFSITFTPPRLGSTTFSAFAVFSDNTFAATTLNYTFQLSGNPLALNLANAPVASMPIGSSTIVGAQALFSNGPVDVSQAVTYKVRSGTTTVLSVDSTGTVTANGPGTDWLDVSYNGIVASAQLSVGFCTYSLSPTNQLVDHSGGAISIQVTTQSGCGWTADTGGAPWLTVANASGGGSGLVELTAAANTTGATQTAIITVANQDVAVVQAATACSYTLSQTEISVPASAGGGTIGVMTSCPIVASSSAPWLTANALNSSVNYSAAANSSGAARSATLTIGTGTVLVNQLPGTDTTPPTTAASHSPQPNANGWNNTNVIVTLNSTDNEVGGTGVKQITYSSSGAQTIANTVVNGASASFTINTEGITTITFFGTDNAGNVESAKALTIQLDKTPPTITPARMPLPNGNGWNNTNVTVSFQCSDALSGLAGGSTPAPAVLSSEGAGQSVTGTCTDLAGNSASSIVSEINIDKTPPTVGCSASPNVLWPPNNKLVPVNVSVTVSNALSGPGGFTLVSVTSNEPDSGQGDIQGFVAGTASISGQLRSQRLGSGTSRVYTFTYSGSDRAGNTASCIATVTVPHDQGRN